MNAGLLVLAFFSGVNAFFWSSKIDLDAVIRKLMYASDEQAPHARQKMVTLVITGTPYFLYVILISSLFTRTSSKTKVFERSGNN